MKYFTSNYSSFYEAKLDPGSVLDYKESTADALVNPVDHWKYKNKKIIFNLPVDLHLLGRLVRLNDVIFRFRTPYNTKTIPYEMPKVRKELDPKDYSFLILTDKLLSSTDHIDDVLNNDFLIGLSETIEGDRTLVGQVIMKTKIENLKIESDEK